MEYSNQNGRNNIKNSAIGYAGLLGKVCSLFLDALTSRTQRRLQYWKSVWELSSRPYQWAAAQGAVRDDIDRTSQILDLTANELKTDLQKAAEFSTQLLSYAINFQDVSLNAPRGVLDTSSVSNVDHVNGATKHQLDDTMQRAQEVERQATATASNN